MLSCESFWKGYTFHWFDFSDEDQQSGNLFTWANPDCWFCYWNRCYHNDIDDHDDKDVLLVFYTPPKRWKSTGIIHPASFDVHNTNSIPCYKNFFKCVMILNKMGHGSLVECLLYSGLYHYKYLNLNFYIVFIALLMKNLGISTKRRYTVNAKLNINIER